MNHCHGHPPGDSSTLQIAPGPDWFDHCVDGDAGQLLGSVGTKLSSTARMDKISVGLTSTDKHVHPVKFDGKVWCFGGQKPKIYACAGFESLEVKVEAQMMTLKFRTFLATTGRP